MSPFNHHLIADIYNEVISSKNKSLAIKIFLGKQIISYNTESFSHFITQDVLLLAGQNDHYVPIKQFTDQILTLTNVHSLTARIFTSEETADTIAK
jgi:hypothetical protein